MERRDHNFTPRDEDFWEKRKDMWIRHHVVPGTELFMPDFTTNGPRREGLRPTRFTCITPMEPGDSDELQHTESWSQVDFNQPADFERDVGFQ